MAHSSRKPARTGRLGHAKEAMMHYMVRAQAIMSVEQPGKSVCGKAAGRRKEALSIDHRFARVATRCDGENAARKPKLVLRDRG